MLKVPLQENSLAARKLHVIPPTPGKLPEIHRECETGIPQSTLSFLTGGLSWYSEMLAHTTVLFLGQNFAKFRPEKYDFNRY
jgi:hypothetical protein